MNKKELEEDIEFLKHLKRSLDDMKHGRVYDFEF